MRRGRAADDALLPYIYSGTALRCIPTPLTSPGRGPGLTENGSARADHRPSPTVAMTHTLTIATPSRDGASEIV